MVEMADLYRKRQPIPKKEKPKPVENTIRSELELTKNLKFKDKITGRFGLEIETEVKDQEKYPVDFLEVNHDTGKIKCKALSPEWECHFDNSLRGYGVEYVLEKPLDYDDAVEALKKFAKETADIPFQKNTPSTSVHVHLNILDETFLTLANFLTVYALVESVLVDFSGPTRKSNLFALPFRVAERNVHSAIKMFKNVSNGEYSWGFSPAHMKYAACNLSTIPAIGSVEIRSFRGTTDVSEIIEWMSILNRLLEYSKSEGLTPPDILTEFRDGGWEFFDSIFGKYHRTLREKVLDFDTLIDRNLWYAFKISRSVDDWSVINTAFSERYKKQDVKPARKRGNSLDSLVDQYVTIAGLQAGQAQPQPTVWGSTFIEEDSSDGPDF